MGSASFQGEYLWQSMLWSLTTDVQDLTFELDVPLGAVLLGGVLLGAGHADA